MNTIDDCITVTFARCCMRRLRSLDTDVALDNREGTAEIPISSRFSFGVLYFSTVSEPYSKQSFVKWSEQTTEPGDGSHRSLFRMMKSSHCFRLLLAISRSSSQNGMRYKHIPCLEFAVLLQPYTTHRSGIILMSAANTKQPSTDVFISENGVLTNCVPESQAPWTTDFFSEKVQIGMFEAQYLRNYWIKSKNYVELIKYFFVLFSKPYRSHRSYRHFNNFSRYPMQFISDIVLRTLTGYVQDVCDKFSAHNLITFKIDRKP